MAEILPTAPYAATTSFIPQQVAALAPSSGRKSRLAEARLTVYASLSECESIWRRAVEDCAGYVFQIFEWQSTWQETIGAMEGVEPYVVHIEDPAGQTLMLIPLGIYRQGWLRVLRFLGGLVTDYNVPLINPDFAAALGSGEIDALWAEIVARLPKVDFVHLRRMPETIEGVSNPFASLSVAVHSENGHAAMLPGSLAEFQADRSTKMFRDNRRKRRRLADKGPVSFFQPTTPEPIAETLGVLRRQKSRRWRETGQRDWFAEPGYWSFYQVLTDRLLTSGRVHLCGLRVGDEIVATKWGTVFRGRYCELINGFEEGEWARLSVGRLLIESAVEWCIAAPDIAIYDLTGGEEAYKQSWADHPLRLFEYMAPRSLTGIAFVAAHRLRARLRRNQRLRNLARRLRDRGPFS